jgi:MFS family permease
LQGFISLGYLADTIGRKPTIWLYYLGALYFRYATSSWSRSETQFSSWRQRTAFSLVANSAWMTIYLPELFPTQVRGTAMSLVFDSSRSFAGIGPLLAGWMISFFGSIGMAAAVMSLIYLVRLIVTPFAGPETNGKALPT